MPSAIGSEVIGMQLNQDHLWTMLSNIFQSSDDGYVKSQFFDRNRSNKNTPETRMWLSALETYINNWLNYISKPNPSTWKLVKDLEEWSFCNDSKALDCITDSVYLVYGIDPDVFLKKFRYWLLTSKPRKVLIMPEREPIIIEEPFESELKIMEII